MTIVAVNHDRTWLTIRHSDGTTSRLLGMWLRGNIGSGRHRVAGQRRFDVRVEPDPANLAFASSRIGMHTDNPYRDPVPGLQLLHCLINDSIGGESLLYDGFAVLMAGKGNRNYSENITIAQHCLLTAAAAGAHRADDTLVAACIIHDVGHWLDDPDDDFELLPHFHDSVLLRRCEDAFGKLTDAETPPLAHFRSLLASLETRSVS